MKQKPYHHKDLKNELIEKGIELVNEYGVDKLSLRSVAKACNVSHAAPYSHFSSKEQLFCAMQSYITDKFSETLEDAISKHKDSPSFLSEFGKAYVSFFLYKPQYFNFLFYQENVRIDLNIDSNAENNYKPFVIYKNQILKLLENTNMPNSKKEDFIIALFAYVHGLTSFVTMKNVHYTKNWEDKITDLINALKCNFEEE